MPPFPEILDPPLYPPNIIKYLFFVLRYLHNTCYQSYFLNLWQVRTRHVFVKHGCPRWQQNPNMAKSLCPKFWTRPTPRGMGCQWSVRNPWMHLQSKFGYCMTIQTLNIALCLSAGRNYGLTDRQTDRPMDRQTDGRTIQTLDAPGGPFRPGA